jgi:hypothetical protein
MIHDSYQSALPSPLKVSSIMALSAVHPIPANQSYKACNKVDGQSGLGPELQSERTLTSAKITSSIAVDCVAHLWAAMIWGRNAFRSAGVEGNAHFTLLAGFVDIMMAGLDSCFITV